MTGDDEAAEYLCRLNTTVWVPSAGMTDNDKAAKFYIAIDPKTDAMLWDYLREANRLVAEDDAHGGRAGTIHALETVLELLRPLALVRNNDDHPLVPLLNLYAALLDLGDGRLDPLLQPQKQALGGRVKAGRRYECMKGAVAFVVDRLSEIRPPLPEAQKKAAKKARKKVVAEVHKEVAAVLRECGVNAARGRFRKPTARTVKGFCESVSAAAELNSELTTSAAEYLELKKQHPLSLHDGHTPDELRTAYLKWLKQYIRAHRGGSSPTLKAT